MGLYGFAVDLLGQQVADALWMEVVCEILGWKNLEKDRYRFLELGSNRFG